MRLPFTIINLFLQQFRKNYAERKQIFSSKEIKVRSFRNNSHFCKNNNSQTIETFQDPQTLCYSLFSKIMDSSPGKKSNSCLYKDSCITWNINLSMIEIYFDYFTVSIKRAYNLVLPPVTCSSNHKIVSITLRYVHQCLLNVHQVILSHYFWYFSNILHFYREHFCRFSSVSNSYYIGDRIFIMECTQARLTYVHVDAIPLIWVNN